IKIIVCGRVVRGIVERVAREASDLAGTRVINGIFLRELVRRVVAGLQRIFIHANPPHGLLLSAECGSTEQNRSKRRDKPANYQSEDWQRLSALAATTKNPFMCCPLSPHHVRLVCLGWSSSELPGSQRK